MEITKYVDIFKALSDPNRLKILSIINTEGEVCACKLLENFKITQPTLAYHMKMLVDSQLVSYYKRGTWCVYKIRYDEFQNIKKFIEKFEIEEMSVQK
jgi:ArsR family transcriptional regulator